MRLGLRREEIENVRLLKDYGIERVRVAYCVVSLALVSRTEGYNDRMAEAIEAKYGLSVYELIKRGD